MVIGHSGCPQLLFSLIYLFHMPLFFICSGFFFKEMTTNDSVLLYLRKRIKGLYVPFVKWSVLFLLFHNIFMVIGVYNSYYGYDGGSSFYALKEMIRKLLMILFTMHDYEELLGGFWFVRALFISSLFIVFISLLWKTQYRYKYEFVCIFFIVITILIRRFAPDPELWRDMSMGSFGAFFYVFGYLMMKYKRHWQNFYFIFICGISFFIMSLYFKNGVAMSCGFNKVIPFSVSAISGTILTICVSKMLEKCAPYIRSVLYYIGNHTLVILALHFLSFRFISFLVVLFYGLDTIHIAEHPVVKDVSFSNNYLWIIYTFGGISLPLLINKFWQVFIYLIKIHK